ncbi:MAG: hypothetical protein MRZ79_21370 [Bacteroidia bacterium]|nr:hypothetical protein [Bacteroidia bacterium]
MNTSSFIFTWVKIILSLTLAFTTSFLWAQENESTKIPKRKYAKYSFPEGYILSLDGDTTFGYIRQKDVFEDQKKIEFYDYYGAKTTYNAGYIKGYGYGEKHLICRPTPYFYSDLMSDTIIFMVRLIDGPAKLYRFYSRRNAFTLKNEAAFFDFLEKPDKSLFEVSYAFRWKRLASAFKDHPKLSREILEGAYKPEDTESIVKYYNSWFERMEEQE